MGGDEERGRVTTNRQKLRELADRERAAVPHDEQAANRRWLVPEAVAEYLLLHHGPEVTSRVAEYIAALSPDVVIGLIDAAEAAEVGLRRVFAEATRVTGADLTGADPASATLGVLCGLGSAIESAWSAIVAMTTPEQRERLGLDREVPGSHTRDLTQVVTRVCDALGEAERERDEARAEVERLRGALKRYADVLASADSLAWSYAARRDPPMLGCVGHRNCANCVRYALRWRERLLGSLAGPRQCALALYG